MQCSALDSDRNRCASQVADSSNYCPADQYESARITGKDGNAPNGNRWTGIFARVRGAFNAPIPDGGKYEVPGWLKDAPPAQVSEHLRTNPDAMVRWMASDILRKRRAPGQSD